MMLLNEECEISGGSAFLHVPVPFGDSIPGKILITALASSRVVGAGRLQEHRVAVDDRGNWNLLARAMTSTRPRYLSVFKRAAFVGAVAVVTSYSAARVDPFPQDEGHCLGGGRGASRKDRGPGRFAFGIVALIRGAC